MARQISERDWKLFRRLQPVALERFCGRVLADVTRVAAGPGSAHERYLAAYRLVRERDRELAAAFDGPSRSMAWEQLGLIVRAGLMTDDEVAGFSDETRAAVHLSVPPAAEHKPERM
jgi:hypothetical protein